MRRVRRQWIDEPQASDSGAAKHCMLEPDFRVRREERTRLGDGYCYQIELQLRQNLARDLLCFSERPGFIFQPTYSDGDKILTFDRVKHDHVGRQSILR